MPALIPWGVKQFTDGNGRPLVSGWVAYCQPGTGGTVLRNVYGDEGETVLLQNPVPLNAAGRPYSGGAEQSIWGDGSYEEYVYDYLGNLITSSIIDTQSSPAAALASTGSGERIGNLSIAASKAQQTRHQDQSITTTPNGYPYMHESTFQYLKPTDAQTETMNKVRHQFGLITAHMLAELPDGPDRDHVIRLLRTAAMWANISITRHADGTPRP
jgi:hypothetical protein